MQSEQTHTNKQTNKQTNTHNLVLTSPGIHPRHGPWERSLRVRVSTAYVSWERVYLPDRRHRQHHCLLEALLVARFHSFTYRLKLRTALLGLPYLLVEKVHKEEDWLYEERPERPSSRFSCFREPNLEEAQDWTPPNELFADMRFEAPLCSYPIKVASGDKTSLRELVVPTGNAIFNLEILSVVFGQLNCTDRSCYGRLRLYEMPLDDGLQSFLLLKCTHCHKLVAEFPATLPIGVSAEDTINNNTLITKGESEINQRSLIAVHTTSTSWEDFRLTCCLLDVKAPSRDMSKTQLTKLMKVSVNVANNSMRIAGKQAYSQATPVTVSQSGLRDSAVSFDASWHRRGHYSNQGFAAAIDTDFGKVLDYALYDRVCYSCSKWPESRRSSCPDQYQDYWASHKDICVANYKGTSQSIESSGAVEVWRRSIDKHNLAYGTYIGDGDSSSFKNLIQSDPYEGAVPIRKEECIGHVQKRLKKRLMKKAAGITSLPRARRT